MSQLKLIDALLKAQKQMENPKLSGYNPHFKSKFAPLDAVLDACLGALADNGIVLLQPPVPSEGGVGVKTLLLHTSGETMDCGTFCIPVAQADSQKYVAALTYARRASLSSVFGLVGEEDKDGEGVVEKPKPKPAPKKASKPNGQLIKFLQVIGELKKEVGDKAYYQCIGGHGVEHANELTEKGKQTAFYKELQMVRDAMKEMA